MVFQILHENNIQVTFKLMKEKILKICQLGKVGIL